MPNTPSFNDALQLTRAGNNVAAERICRQLLSDNANNPPVWCHLGTTLLIQGRLHDAVGAYEKALQLQPVFPEALNNLAVTLTRLERADDAIRAFERAAQQRPQWAEPLISLGNLYTNQDRTDQAVASYRRALQAEPAKPEAHNQLASMLAKQGRQSEAIRHFIEAIRLHPRYDVAHSNLLQALNYQAQMDPAVLLNEHLWWDRLHGCGLTAPPSHNNSRGPDRPLRIGYVSPDFRKHVVSAFLLPIFTAHDSRQVQIFAYAEVAQLDDVSEKYRALSTGGWRLTVGQSHPQVAEQIRADGIDILVDLAGHTGGNRLSVFALRPAPVQISYLGYPNTTGLAAMQYRITDAVADPQDQPSHCTEELVRLPGVFCCYDPPANAPPVATAPVDKNGYVTFGSMHKLPKLNEMMIDLWSELLRRVNDARLLIFRNTLDASVKQSLIQQFAQRGIDARRLEIFSGSAREAAHLPVYSRIDIALDTLPWSGHATTCEATWMGVPTITIRGNRHAGRMSASILGAVGLGECIAESSEQYLSLASSLANDRQRLVQMRQNLRERMRQSSLCDSRGFTRSLESAYRAMWKRWCVQG